MKYWCPECEDFHEVTEMALPRGLVEQMMPRQPPRDSVRVVEDSLSHLFQWIEEVKATIAGQVIHLKIKHSYPKGINIAKNVKQWLDANLAPNVTAKVTYRRVAPVKRGR